MTILYADDDSDDRILVSEVFKEIDPSISCLTVCDGGHAIDVLHKATALPEYFVGYQYAGDEWIRVSYCIKK